MLRKDIVPIRIIGRAGLRAPAKFQRIILFERKNTATITIFLVVVILSLLPGTDNTINPM